MRVILAFVAAVLVAFFLGAAVLTGFDQAGFAVAHGGPLSFGQRLGWYLVTMKGLALEVGLYPLLLGVGLLIAFLAAAFVKRIAPNLRFWWYAGAGAVAIVTLVLTLKAVMGLFVIPGARTVAGIAAQGVVGLVAGGVFAMLSRRSEQRGRFSQR